MKKVLITGASGFIGSFLVEEALQQGFDVVAGIRKSSSKEFLQHPGIRFIELDFSSPSILRKQLEDFTRENGSFHYIIHNAGITSARAKGDFHMVNYQYAQFFIEVVKAMNLPLEKFILISSLATYGPGDAISMKPICVDDVCMPVSEYGKSKLRASQYLASSGLPYIVVHPTGVYGPRDRGFLQMIKLVNRGLEPYVGRHSQKISLIYVKDLSRAVIALLHADAVQTSFLLSDGEHYDKAQIAVEAKKILNRKTIQLTVPLRVAQWGVSCHDVIHQLLFKRLPFIDRQKLDEISSANWLCSSAPIWEVTGLAPAYSLTVGMEETITWYKEHKWLS